MGNIFARRPGRDNSLPPVMAGSHLDSQPTGGKFDGAYGVLAGLEVVRALNDADFETDAPIEVAVWTNEEGSRFPPAMVGSGAFAGIFDLAEAHGKSDIDGKTIGEELSRIGYRGEGCGGRDIGAYFEAHIEQGPVLEDTNTTIGVVTGGQAQRWYEIILTGQESHAGPTPMAVRRDALVGAAEIVGVVNRIGHDFQPGACSTVGMMQVSPNSRNVIPGEVFMTVDFRHPDDDRLKAMNDELQNASEAVAAKHGLQLNFEQIWSFAATPFDPQCIDAVRDGAVQTGASHMDIVSGAGHDAIYMAGVAPSGMIFVPCEGGVSHNEIENATVEDIATGCQVLLHAMVAKAGASKAGDG
jgi:N-carbamoyl-L-amino-acid hydrolase